MGGNGNECPTRIGTNERHMNTLSSSRRIAVILLHYAEEGPSKRFAAHEKLGKHMNKTSSAKA
jgi:hypothetical protein